MNNKRVIILIGPPGSGKGTQAEMLASRFGLAHLETSELIEDKFNNANPNDGFLSEQKKRWESGILNDPEFVVSLVAKKIKELSSDQKGIVFSASPRTLFETEQEIPIIEKLYDKENIKILNIQLSEHSSIERNSSRRICKKNRHPIPNFPEYKNIIICPTDGSPIKTRALDKSDVIRVRYQEYLNRTAPIIVFLKTRGYRVIEINGEQPIEKVLNDITEKLND